ncbi:hypothetical protein BT63DRAFT_365862 [Microthyrium microscopicum]|uniref:alpha-galactosidase n=1 Tax=Microthyrium microscopicum TaxID=703497 RepID=A0A6A6UU37_9PEZI|nr:hypothetical protein BT63DRAFT_365862 [Microthyrium microscopicum]
MAVLAVGAAHAKEACGDSGIWQPDVDVKYQMILTGVVDPTADLQPDDAEIYDIDLFYHPKSTIDWLHDQGKKVVCYFDAGSAEDWRPDYHRFEDADKGPCYVGWAGERWLNATTTNVWSIMQDRIALAAAKGCDGIDPDNVEYYDEGNFFNLTREDAIVYVKKIAAEAHSYGMAMGLKNAGDIVHDVLNDIEFAVNEECASGQGDDCKYYEELIAAGKPVLHIEYVSNYTMTDNSVVISSTDKPGESSEALKAQYCFKNNTGYADTFSTTIKVLSLNGWVLYCDDTVATTVTTSDGVHKGLIDCPNGN